MSGEWRLSDVLWMLFRLSLAYVYLFALYQNTKDQAARTWLVTHTGYMLRSLSPAQVAKLAPIAAWSGMVMMLVGGASILFGIEGRVGALLLLVFTAIGIWQHRMERVVAMECAGRLDRAVTADGKADLDTLRWSAYSWHFSSGLKNWALCGSCLAILTHGTGPLSISDRLLAHFF